MTNELAIRILTGDVLGTLEQTQEAIKIAVEALIVTARPEYSMDEWCTDCTEYDHEQHCCPRFNRVIRETIEEIKQNRWTPRSEKPYPEKEGTYLVTDVLGGTRSVHDSEYYICQDGTGVWSDGAVVAWMPMPEAYEGDKE